MTPREDKEDSVKTPCKKESSGYPAFAASAAAYDFLGRVVSVSTPNSSLLTPPSYSVTSNVYDGASSLLLRVSRTSSPDTLYSYDALGNVSATALDVDGDGQITYAGSDRINSTVTRYEDDTNGWWRVMSSSVWIETGSDACVTSSVTRARQTGLGASAPATPGLPSGAVLTAQTGTLDWRGNVTRSTTYTDAGSASSGRSRRPPDRFSPRPKKQSPGTPFRWYPLRP